MKHWLEGEDEFFKALAEGYIEDGRCPNQDEAVNVLGFLIVFSMGYRHMNLDVLADLYSKRSDEYVCTLRAMGFETGWRFLGNYERGRSSLDTVILRASNMVRLDL